MWDSIQLFLLHLLSPALGDHKYSARLKYILGKPVILKPESCLPSPQILPDGFHNKTGLSSSLAYQIPLHLHCSNIVLPYLGKKKKMVELQAPLPSTFQKTLDTFNLNVQSEVAKIGANIESVSAKWSRKKTLNENISCVTESDKISAKKQCKTKNKLQVTSKESKQIKTENDGRLESPLAPLSKENNQLIEASEPSKATSVGADFKMKDATIIGQQKHSSSLTVEADQHDLPEVASQKIFSYDTSTVKVSLDTQSYPDIENGPNIKKQSAKTDSLSTKSILLANNLPVFTSHNNSTKSAENFDTRPFRKSSWYMEELETPRDKSPRRITVTDTLPENLKHVNLSISQAKNDNYKQKDTIQSKRKS